MFTCIMETEELGRELKYQLDDKEAGLGFQWDSLRLGYPRFLEGQDMKIIFSGWRCPGRGIIALNA